MLLYKISISFGHMAHKNKQKRIIHVSFWPKTVKIQILQICKITRKGVRSSYWVYVSQICYNKKIVAIVLVQDMACKYVSNLTINVILWYVFVVVNFDALAQASDFRIERRQLVFLCWEQDSNPGGLWNPIFSRLNACWQTDWAIEDQAKNLNSTARPYDQQAFSPPDPTAIWHSHLALAIYIFVVVNFDALAQASDFRIERRQLVFLCWEQDSNPGGLWNPIFSRLNACWQTDWAIEDQAKNLNSTARPYDQQAFSPPDPTAIWHSQYMNGFGEILQI